MLSALVDLASRAAERGQGPGLAPGGAQGDETALFWDITLPAMGRGAFKWQRLLDAPVIALPLADQRAYTARYSEPDKAGTGLGAGTQAWPAPYWTIDSSMAVMTLLLAAEDAGLGALFFGVFKGERRLRQRLRIPPGLDLLGAIALGHRCDESGVEPPGRSTGRSRRRPNEIIHLGGW